MTAFADAILTCPRGDGGTLLARALFQEYGVIRECFTYTCGHSRWSPLEPERRVPPPMRHFGTRDARPCKQCGKPLPIPHQANRKYCTACLAERQKLNKINYDIAIGKRKGAVQ